MPLYDFVCDSCGKDFEKLLSLSNHTKYMKKKLILTCDACKDGILKQQLGATKSVAGINLNQKHNNDSTWVDILKDVKDRSGGNKSGCTIDPTGVALNGLDESKRIQGRKTQAGFANIDQNY